MSDENKKVVSEEQQTPAQVQIVDQTNPETTQTINEENAAEVAVESVESVFDQEIDYNTKSLKELVDLFNQLLETENHQVIYKNAEVIKATFYKTLKKEKIAGGYAVVENPVLESDVAGEDLQNELSQNPFQDIENEFKSIYSKYKSLRATFVQEQEKKKEDNYKEKLAIIEELKTLIEKQDDPNKTFPEFRNLQNKWRSVGPVPQANHADIYNTYKLYEEKFYDYVKISKDLRDLDFKKNLDVKLELCQKAEDLINEDNVVEAFKKLQKLHEEWKEYGPVDKENREQIWERFRQATSAVNKKHQAYFEGQKEVQKENLAKKTALCEKVEEIAQREITDSNMWNTLSKEIESIQKEWKTIGFASKKDNQKIYDRFRAACDNFFARKRDFYVEFKSVMQENIDKKIKLCEEAEALQDSTDWKKATDQLINLQKLWKESGPVSRKKSDQIWKRFRAACDHFFENKNKHFGTQDVEFDKNLEAKLALIEEIKNYVSESDSADLAAFKDFQKRWESIGFVPFKMKDKVAEAYNSALSEKFGDVKNQLSERRPRRSNRQERGNRQDRAPRSERDRLIQKFVKIEQEIATYENNIGFFAKSKNADALLEGLRKKIDVAKEELKQIEEQIKVIDNQVEE
ncbi:MAG: DUF349 domain-containing protein [Bacteroidales bacterium]|nr:DUF349 domain-containing protein [Bacteroidales bacterium]